MVDDKGLSPREQYPNSYPGNSNSDPKSSLSHRTSVATTPRFVPQSRDLARITPGYLNNTGYWRVTGTERHNNNRLTPIAAGNVIFATRWTANMASKQLLTPLRRALAQNARQRSSICFQCQRRWQSKVSQRPGSDRYAFEEG